MANPQDISRVIARLSAAFPNWNVNEYTIQVYCEDLRDIPADELEEAARACRKEPGRAFAPTIGELRAAWMEYRENRPVRALPQLSEGPPPVYVPIPDHVRERLGKLVKSKEIKNVRNSKTNRRQL